METWILHPNVPDFLLGSRNMDEIITLILCRKWDKHLLQQRNGTTIKNDLTQKSSAGFQRPAIGMDVSWVAEWLIPDRGHLALREMGRDSQRVSLCGDALCFWDRPLLPSQPGTNAGLAFSVRWGEMGH